MKHAKAIYGSSTTSKKEKTSSVPGGPTTASVEVVECIAETTSETASGGIKSFAEMGVVVANAAIGEANRGRPAGANASSCGSGSHIEQVHMLNGGETHYSYTPSYARAVRGRRGDDVRAERCRRVRRDQAALGGVLGVHVVDFTSFLPNRETDRPRLESTVRALARQRGVVVRSSPARDLATVLGRRPRPLGVRVAPSHPLRLAPAGALTAHFLSPAVVLARRRHDATRERDEPLDSTPTLEPAPLPCSGVRWGTLTT